MATLSISQGNSKLGKIPSISLPAGITCRPCACAEKCYAKKLERLRPTVANAYRHNLEVLRTDPETYWREVEAVIMLSRYFRFHVSGDIPDQNYFANMVTLARRNPHCKILCFTKQYDIVNDFVGGFLPEHQKDVIPENLQIVFSAWVGLPMTNPFSFPEAHVLYRDGTTTATETAKPCGGNCTLCAVRGTGCWTLKPGEQIVFKEH